MDTLVKIGTLAATPFVLEFLLSLLPEHWQKKIADNLKRLAAVLVGVVLEVLIALYQDVFPVETRGMLFLALNGAVNGAMATGGVALVMKVAEKARSTTKVTGAETVTVNQA